MAESRVSQIPVEYSGLPATTNAKVSQIPVEYSGLPLVTKAQVSQIVVEYSGLVALFLGQTATYVDPDTFPSGGDIHVQQGLPIDQDTTYVDPDTFPVGGTIASVLSVVQDTTYVDPDSFPAGGQLYTAQFLGQALGSGGGLAAPIVRAPNDSDRALEKEYSLWAAAFAAPEDSPATLVPGGMRGLGNLPGFYPPWMRKPIRPMQTPHGSRLFFERGSIVTPGPGADTLIYSFKVPTGYFGIIHSYYTHYTGGGWEDGSGDIFWRVKVGNAWVRDMGAIGYQVGGFANPWPMQRYVLLMSQQLVQVFVNVPNVSGNIDVGTSRVLAGLQGWFYPLLEM